MVWIDTHAHLHHKPYMTDFEAVLAKSRAAGVSMVLLPGTDIDDSRDAVDVVSRHQGLGLISAVGVHPHEAKSYNDNVAEQLRALARVNRGNVVAIGEIGLDYHYDFSPRDIQREVFMAQIRLAHELDLPVIVHDRESTADCLEILDQADKARLLRPVAGVFHCFSGSVETAQIVLKHGFYLGFDGPITFKNARKSLDVIAACPRDRLVLETDSPYLTPEPHRGHRNTPEYIPLIGAKVAEVWGCTVEEVADQTTQNARKLFGLEL